MVKYGAVNYGVQYGAGAKVGVVYTRQNMGRLLGYYKYELKDGVTKNMGHNLGQDAKLKHGVKRGVECNKKDGVEHGAPYHSKTWGNNILTFMNFTPPLIG